MIRTCVICGAPFKGEVGTKARKTCSSECSLTLMRACRVNAKGDDATPQAARGRARLLASPECCDQCGTRLRLEVHHRDGDPYNNASENLRVLCVPCHKATHRMPPRVCVTCGQLYQPNRRSSRFCTRHCSGVATARGRYHSARLSTSVRPREGR